MNEKLKIRQVIEFVKEHNLVRPRDLAEAGLPKDYLYQLARSGKLMKVSRGLYQWPGKEINQHQSLMEIAKKSPQTVVTLLSALRFHELTTLNPHEVWLAIDRKTRCPIIDYQQVRWVYFSGKAMTEGVEEYLLDGVRVKVFTPVKTVVDCFKYRNKIGLDVALEALRDGWTKKQFTMDELHYFAKICRVLKVMQPYLETLL